MSIPDYLSHLEPTEARKRLSEAEHMKQLVFPMRQSEVARYCGVERMTIYNWYSGRTPIPQLAFRALSRINLFHHMKNDSVIKRRLCKLAANGSERAQKLYKDLYNHDAE